MIGLRRMRVPFPEPDAGRTAAATRSNTAGKQQPSSPNDAQSPRQSPHDNARDQWSLPVKGPRWEGRSVSSCIERESEKCHRGNPGSSQKDQRPTDEGRARKDGEGPRKEQLWTLQGHRQAHTAINPEPSEKIMKVLRKNQSRLKECLASDPSLKGQLVALPFKSSVTGEWAALIASSRARGTAAGRCIEGPGKELSLSIISWRPDVDHSSHSTQVREFAVSEKADRDRHRGKRNDLI